MRELTSTTAAEAAQVAAGEGSARGNDVWRRACAAGSLSEAAWKVLDGNEPLLHRYNHEQAHGSHASDMWCMVPLKGLSGGAFGVILSGPPALPVQLVERLANSAGTHLEEAWRRRMLDHLLDVAVAWVRSP